MKQVNVLFIFKVVLFTGCNDNVLEETKILQNAESKLLNSKQPEINDS